MQLDTLKTFFAVIASLVTILGGGYTLFDKIGFKWTRPVLTWHIEDFYIVSGPMDEPFRIVVAREKHRDDCELISFKTDIQDSNLEVYQVTTSSQSFSGPASDKVEKFAFKFYLMEKDYNNIAMGKAKFIASLKYSCPEGDQIISYPSDLDFTIYIPNIRPD